MRILHLVSGDLIGGAARGAYSLHMASREIGIESTLLTNSLKNYEDPSVTGFVPSASDRFRSRLLAKLSRLSLKAYPNRESWIFNIGLDGLDVTKHPAFKQAEIVHLHWINGFINLHTIGKIGVPVVWTLRDMWPFTGGCHYSMGCERYKSGCGNCAQLHSIHKWDITRIENKYKKRSLPDNLTVVGLSDWISTCAAESQIFRGKRIETIGNNISDIRFFPLNQSIARRELGLPSGKKIVLVGANKVNNFYKGFDLFLGSLETINTEDIHLLIFGSIAQATLDKLEVDYTSLGFVESDEKLRFAYSAADVFVAPSRMEAFGKTLVEALACGTPVVCFDATGPKDIIQHKVTGYKARPFDEKDLAKGIDWVLEQPIDEQLKMRGLARAHMMNNFSPDVIAHKYQSLYTKILLER